jgi:phosphoribosyl 1,2-cyclic phosphodiesterase
MTELITLGSGSRGNATLLRTSRTAILIDAGLSARQLTLRLTAVDHDPADIDAIVITHEHSDHIGGVPVFARRAAIPVLANEATSVAGGAGLREIDTLETFTSGRSFTIGDITVHPFAISHDAAEPVGYRFEADGMEIGYATDLGHIDGTVVEMLAGCVIVVLETNHDRNMLYTGPYPAHTKRRIDSEVGHLSNEAAAEALLDIISGTTREIVLAHLSETNNLPRLAEAAVTGAFRRNGVTGIRIHVADQNTPGQVIS